MLVSEPPPIATPMTSTYENSGYCIGGERGVGVNRYRSYNTGSWHDGCRATWCEPEQVLGDRPGPQ